MNKYEPKAKAAKDKAEFGKSVNDMIADFGDSHFGFFTKSDQGFYMMQSLVSRPGTEMPHIGAWFRPAARGFEIQMLVEGGVAAGAGLRKGDVVTQIDGQPFTPVDSLAAKVGQKVKLTYSRNDATMV